RGNRGARRRPFRDVTSLIKGPVSPHVRCTLVAFTAQGIAAFVAGRMIAALGYGPVLAGAAGIAVLAAGLFATLRRYWGIPAARSMYAAISCWYRSSVNLRDQ